MERALEKQISKLINDGLDAAYEIILERVTKLYDEQHSAVKRERAPQHDDVAELRYLREELEYTQDEPDQSAVKFIGRWIRGTAAGDAHKKKKRGSKPYFMYKRPSGYIWYLPFNGSSREDRTFKLIARLAIDKLIAEIAWVEAGRPKDQGPWNYAHGHQVSSNWSNDE